MGYKVKITRMHNRKISGYYNPNGGIGEPTIFSDKKKAEIIAKRYGRSNFITKVVKTKQKGETFVENYYLS